MDELIGFLGMLIKEEHAGKIEPKSAVQINNTAGKMISAAKAQIIYMQVRNSLGDKGGKIAFLESVALQFFNKNEEEEPSGNKRIKTAK